MAESTEQPVSDSLFRRAKRRKVFRRLNSDPASHNRHASPHETPPSAHQHIGASGSDEDARNESSMPVSQALKVRKQAKGRRLGVGFSNESSGPRLDPTDPTTGMAGDLVLHDDKPITALDHATDRFVPQTGQVTASADQHM